MVSDVSLLFCGDIQEEALTILVKDEEVSGCTVLKVPHHGRGELSSDDFIDLVSPEFAVISDSVHNSKHYSDSIIEILQSIRSKVYVTGLDGAVTISTDGNNVEVETFVEGTCI